MWVNTSYMNPVGEAGFAVKFEGRCNVCVDISMNINSNEEIFSPSKNIFLITSIRMWTWNFQPFLSEFTVSTEVHESTTLDDVDGSRIGLSPVDIWRIYHYLHIRLLISWISEPSTVWLPPKKWRFLGVDDFIFIMCFFKGKNTPDETPTAGRRRVRRCVRATGWRRRRCLFVICACWPW